jgi:hypothetical protein
LLKKLEKALKPKIENLKLFKKKSEAYLAKAAEVKKLQA